MTYIFALRSVTDKRLLPQLDAALAAYSELGAREPLPKVWRAVDGTGIGTSVSAAVLRRRRRRGVVMGILLLIMGFFLFVPDFLAHQPLSGSMLVGMGAFLWGIIALLGRDRKPKEAAPETPAQQLLTELGGSGRKGAHAIFSEDALAVETPDGERAELGFAALDAVLETRDLLFLIGATCAVTLQKSELSWGEWPEFREFLAEKTEIEVVLHQK